MSDLFNQDNAFNRVMTRIFDLALLNILWTVCCLPVITIGASSIAIYTVTLKMIKNEEGSLAGSFFKAFRENFRQSVPVTLVLIAGIALLTADFHILRGKADANSSLIYGVNLVLLLFLTAIFSYVFPLLAKFENTVRNTFSNAWKIAATHIGETFLLVLINCIPFLLLLFFPAAFARVFWIWLLLGTSSSALADSYFLNKIFAEFIPKAPQNDEDVR